MQVISLTFFKRVTDETNPFFHLIVALYLNFIESVTSSGGDQTSWHGGGVRDEWLKAKLFCWDAELNQLGFVDANGVVVSLGGVSKGVFEIPENTVLGFDGFFHVLADVIYSWLVEATSLHELSQCQLLLLQLSHEYAQLVFKLLVLIVSSALQLVDCNLELAVHFIFLLFNLFVFLVKFHSVALNLLSTILQVFETTLSVSVTHHVFIESKNDFTQLIPLLFRLGKRSKHVFDSFLEFKHGRLVLSDLSFDVLVLFFEKLDNFEVFPGNIVVVLFHLAEGRLMVDH